MMIKVGMTLVVEMKVEVGDDGRDGEEDDHGRKKKPRNETHQHNSAVIVPMWKQPLRVKSI